MSEKKKSILLIVVIYFFLVGGILLLGRIFFWQQCISYAETHFGSTHNIELLNLQSSRLIYQYAFLHLVLGVLSLWLLNIRTKITSCFLLYENEKGLSSFLPFFWSSIIGLYLFGLFISPMSIFQKRLIVFREDNIFETMTVILLLVSAILLIMSALIVKKIKKLDRNKSYNSILNTYIIISVIIFIFAMEEISWGQRVLSLSTPSFYNQINVQQEINIHNLFRHGIVIILYSLVSISFILLLISTWLFAWKNRSNYHQFVFPHPQLYVLAILVAIAGCGRRYDELFEELMSIFILFYSIRVIKYCRLKYNNLIGASDMSGVKNMAKTSVKA